MTKIGVFDSGIGGKAVANAIGQALPDADVIFVNDSQNVPYGTKSPELLINLALPILEDLAAKTDVIVIACNTISTTIINQLRNKLSVPLIGMEPMLEQAASTTKSGVVAICATPTTLASERYAELKHSYAKNILIYEPDCSDWALMIEQDRVNRLIINASINEACMAGADVIVLGCTHYHWIEDLVTEAAGDRAVILQPEELVINQLRQILLT